MINSLQYLLVQEMKGSNDWRMMNALQSSLVHEMEGSKMIKEEKGKRGFPSHSLAKGKRHILENKERKDFVGKYRVFKKWHFEELEQ